MTTELYGRINNEFDIITWDVDSTSFRIAGMTPRQYRGLRIFSAVPFYYINQIGFESVIYDIGCGWNVYKKYLPTITGISAEPIDSPFFYADEHGYFDDQYVNNNIQRFDNVMTMNSLHFIPLSELTKQITRLKAVTKPKGKIFVMMNVCHLIDNEENTVIRDNAGEYIRAQMDQFSKDLLCFELNDSQLSKNLSEGTLRFVLNNDA